MAVQPFPSHASANSPTTKPALKLLPIEETNALHYPILTASTSIESIDQRFHFSGITSCVKSKYRFADQLSPELSPERGITRPNLGLPPIVSTRLTKTARITTIPLDFLRCLKEPRDGFQDRQDAVRWYPHSWHIC